MNPLTITLALITALLIGVYFALHKAALRSGRTTQPDGPMVFGTWAGVITVSGLHHGNVTVLVIALVLSAIGVVAQRAILRRKTPPAPEGPEAFHPRPRMR